MIIPHCIQENGDTYIKTNLLPIYLIFPFVHDRLARVLDFLIAMQQLDCTLRAGSQVD